MKELFYVLQCSGDGDVSLTTYTKEGIEKALNSGDLDGDQAQIPVSIDDVAAGEYPLVIIKGIAVLPTEKRTVKEWVV